MLPIFEFSYKLLKKNYRIKNVNLRTHILVIVRNFRHSWENILIYLYCSRTALYYGSLIKYYKIQRPHCLTGGFSPFLNISTISTTRFGVTSSCI